MSDSDWGWDSLSLSLAWEGGSLSGLGGEWRRRLCESAGHGGPSDTAAALRLHAPPESRGALTCESRRPCGAASLSLGLCSGTRAAA
eukprot:3344957-Rhodomonas_salina.1